MQENILEKDSKSYNVLLKRLSNNNSILNNDSISLPKNLVPLILIGDVYECLKKIPSKSISVVVTSPPYWNLRDYESDNQLGRETTPQEYVESIVNVGEEILRVLKDDGAYFLNIGDTYVNQNLQMIPQRIAISMQERGWLLRNQLVWYKPNHMPSPVKSRFKNTYEPIFFFTKNDWEKKVCFNLDEIRIPYKTQQFDLKFTNGNYNGKFKGNEKNIGASPGGRLSIAGESYIIKRKIKATQNEICDYLRYWRDKRSLKNQDIINVLGQDYFHTVGHWFRKDAGGSYPSTEDWKNLKKILRFDDKYDKEMTETEKVLQTIRFHPQGKNPGDVIDADSIPDFFKINTAKTNYKHFAVFPEKIPEIAIKSCCPKDGIVLDPFAGSGTTGLVAKKLKRKSILIDNQKKFLQIMEERIGIIEVQNENS